MSWMVWWIISTDLWLPSTGMLKYFDIVPYESGFVLFFRVLTAGALSRL